MKSKTSIAIIIGCCLVWTIGSAAGETNVNDGSPITIGELRDHVYFLASDYLNGRAPGFAGYEIAAQYAASQFRQAGLDSIIVSPDGSKSFFQEIKLRQRRLDRLAITLDLPDGPVTFELGSEIKPLLLDYSAGGNLAATAVFVGYGISEPESGWDDLEGLDLEGKVVILLDGSPERDGKAVLPEEVNAKYTGPRGMMPKLQAIAKFDPAAVIVEAGPLALERWDAFPNDGMWPTAVHDAGDALYYHFIHMEIPRFGLLRTNILMAKRPLIEAALTAQRHPSSGKDDAGEVTKRSKSGMEGIPARITRSYSDEVITTWNVVAGLEGSDPDLKHEYVIVGAHLDHFPPRRGQIMNGADDNASGCAGVMEIAEALSASRPRRSVLFMLLSSEENGLYGSRHFNMNLPVPAENVKLYINLDMIGHTVAELQEQRGVYISGTSLSCDVLMALLDDANDPDFRVGLVREADDETFKRTDQFFFFENRIQTIGFEAGYNEIYHQPTDDPERVDYDKVRDVSRMVLSFMLKLANTEIAACGEE